MNTKSIKPGTFQTGRTKGGLNLNKFIKDVLVSMGFAGTENCCTYYPTFPELDVVNISAPTEEEMANVPIKGLFFAVNEDGYWYLRVKNSVNTSIGIVTND